MKLISHLIGCGLLAVGGMAEASDCTNTFNWVNLTKPGTLTNYQITDSNGLPTSTYAGRGVGCSYWSGNPSQTTTTTPGINADNLWRTALVCPPVVTTDTPPPVVFAFHGAGGCGVDFAVNTQIHVAWPQALVIYPDGIPNPGNGSSAYSLSVNAGYTGWAGPSPYYNPVFPPLSSQATTSGWQWMLGMLPAQNGTLITQGMSGAATLDLDFVNEMIKAVAAAYQTTPSALSLYAVGHSEGAAFTSLLYNLSSGQQSSRLGKSYQNFTYFRAFAFNTVAPNSAFDGSNNTNADLLGAWAHANTPTTTHDLSKYVTDNFIGPSKLTPSNLLTGGPAKPMLISLDCYDETIPYAISYPSIGTARSTLGVTSVPNSNLSTGNLGTVCSQLQSHANFPNGKPYTTIEYDQETGSGPKMEVLVNTEYLNAQNTAPTGTYPAFPGQGHGWPTFVNMAQLYGMTLPGTLKLYSNHYADDNGTVYTEAQIPANTHVTPTSLTWKVVDFFQKDYSSR